MNERKELIARLRDYTYEGDPRHLMEAAADMLEADAQPQYGWLTACDEEMIVANIGVAELSDSYEIARRKLGELIAWHVAVATDPAVNGGLSLQPAVPQETCRCDENNIGEPGMSCGDCPRDYAKTAPQEPVAWDTVYKAVSAATEACTQATGMHRQIRLFVGKPQITHDALGTDAAPQPQRPRLTDEEIMAIHLQEAEVTKGGTSNWAKPLNFARAIEKKVRGEA